MSSAIPKPRSIRSSTACAGSISAGTSNIASPTAWRCTIDMARSDLREGPGLSRFHPGRYRRRRNRARGEGAWLFNPGHARAIRAKRATGAPPPASRSCCASACRATGPPTCAFATPSTASKSNPPPISKTSLCCAATACPTYHLASCADDADLRISHIIRGQDHLTNTFKHVLIFEAAGADAAAVRASAAADRARWRQALQAQARPGGQRHHLSRRRISAPCIRQFPLPAGLVAQERSRMHEPPGTDRRVLLRRHQPQQRGREFHRRRPLRSQSRSG